MASSRYKPNRRSARRLIRSSRRKLTSPTRKKPTLWIVLALVIVLVLAFLFYGDGLWYTFKFKKQVVEMEVRTDSLKELNTKMRARIEKLKVGDSFAIEEEARSHGMVMKGEKVYVEEKKGKKK